MTVYNIKEMKAELNELPENCSLEKPLIAIACETCDKEANYDGGENTFILSREILFFHCVLI